MTDILPKFTKTHQWLPVVTTGNEWLPKYAKNAQSQKNAVQTPIFRKNAKNDVFLVTSGNHW